MDVFNKLIDEAVLSLVNDTASQSAECLQELAVMFSKAGQPKESFLDVRQYIVNQAEKLSSTTFIHEKLLVEERNLRESRNGTR